MGGHSSISYMKMAFHHHVASATVTSHTYSQLPNVSFSLSSVALSGAENTRTLITLASTHCHQLSSVFNYRIFKRDGICQASISHFSSNAGCKNKHVFIGLKNTFFCFDLLAWQEKWKSTFGTGATRCDVRTPQT